VIALAMLVAMVMHDFAYFVWLNVDHDSAALWMQTLGAVDFCHCWGESGPLSHLPEVEDAAIVVGGALGAIGLPFAGVALARCRRADLSVPLAIMAFCGCVGATMPGAVILWTASHVERRELPRSWYARLAARHFEVREQGRGAKW
jgi:hypothetical protein